MFKFREGARIDKVPDGDSAQLNLHQEFDLAELHTPQALHEDKEREEEAIKETLTRSEWEKQMREEADMDSANRQEAYESSQEREKKNSARVLAELAENKKNKNKADYPNNYSEADKPGYELYGRFIKYKKSGRK